MSYKHLTIEDRSKIEVLYQQSYSANQIAEAIGRHRSTIYRELKRVESASYDAQLAQANATEHQSLKGRRPKHTPELIQDIQTKLELTWSPEQIVGRCYQNRLSFKTEPFRAKFCVKWLGSLFFILTRIEFFSVLFLFIVVHCSSYCSSYYEPHPYTETYIICCCTNSCS